MVLLNSVEHGQEDFRTFLSRRKYSQMYESQFSHSLTIVHNLVSCLI